MKPAIYIVITGQNTWRFSHRAAARAFATACKLAGHPAIIKTLF